MKYKKPKIKFNQKWLLFGDGLALKTIFIKYPEKETSFKLIAHELWHIREQQRLGFFKWLKEYSKELIRKGYKNHYEERSAWYFADKCERSFQASDISWEEYVELIIKNWNG